MPRVLLLLCASLPLLAQEQVYVVTHVDLMPTFAVDGGKLLAAFAEQARKDAGAVRYEIIVEPSRRNHLTIVSVWQSRQAFDKHLALPHTRTFREKLQPMLGSLFDERLHVILAP